MSDPEPSLALAETLVERAMTARMRLVWLIILLIIQLLYFPINRTVTGGVVLTTPWDAAIPLWPIWVIPYLLSPVWWTGCYFWAAWKMDDDLYQAFIIGLITVMLAGYAIYIAYPTYVVRPSLRDDHLLTRLLGMLYDTDRVNNAFPSGHTYNTALLALFWSRWYPRQRWLWLAITLLILFSTLFTRQHNLPDLIGGITLAWLGYRFGLWWVAHHPGRG